MTGRADPLISTQKGEAEVVLQDIGSCEQTQETTARLKILAPVTRKVLSDGDRIHIGRAELVLKCRQLND